MSFPKNTAECIRHLFPNSIPESDWSVSIHGDGKITIDNWNDSLGTKPTEEQLNNVAKDAEKTGKLRWVREKRNSLLTETDWMSGSDVNMDDKWKKYRQDLRDLPASNADPDKIVFPTKP